MNSPRISHLPMLALSLAILAGSTGCTAFMQPRDPYPVTTPDPPTTSTVPRELEKVSLPRYVIEPPDILLVEGVRLVPKSPHELEVFDVVLIRATGNFPEQPIDNTYNIDADGTVNLGPTYGRIKISGDTVDEAETTLQDALSNILADVEISVSLVASAGAQQVTGQHLVGPDGRVNLGTYGQVYVAGATLEQARTAIEQQLSKELDDPEVFVDILAYNSKVYYIVTADGGAGDNIARLPITGNETVLDAVANIGGISQLSTKNLWIARPAPNGVGCEQILPVDWKSISSGAVTATNYQMMPGDRLYIAGNKFTKFGSVMRNVLSPFEQIFGITSLGTSMANQIDRFGLGLSGSRNPTF